MFLYRSFVRITTIYIYCFHAVDSKLSIEENLESKCNVRNGAAVNDLVTSLPGWSSDLPSCQYSGFINVKGEDGYDHMVHYYYMESENDPETDPLLVWSNGGPGASSIYGIMVELGPFRLNDESLIDKKAGVPTLFRNPESWTKIGNLVMFDWPPPVGFSYCNDDVKGAGTACGDWNDERFANVAFGALKGFMEERFPDILVRGNPLYLTGESYAGVYVPKLAQEILSHDKMELWNLKGFAVGDACVGTEVLCGPFLGVEVFGPWYAYLFLYGHGQFSNKLWDELISSCGVDNLKYVQKPPHDAADCDKAHEKVSKQVGGYFAYNLYDECIYESDFRLRNVALRQKYAPASFERRFLKADSSSCGGGTAQQIWVDHPLVRDALHLPLESNFVDGDNGEGMNYFLTEKNLMPFYQHVIQHTPLKVMVYNGDTDPGLNSFTTQNWTSSLNIPEKKEWRPWTVDNCRYMGGYITEYTNDFSFVTIRGSGHMVPHDKPYLASELISNFIYGNEFKVYNATCSSPWMF